MPFFERTLTQLMTIHNALHEGDAKVVERGVRHPIETVRRPGFDFRRVEIEPYDFLTQNLEKDSPATEEVKKAEKKGETLRITWVIKRTYVGRIETRRTSNRPESYKVNDFVNRWENSGLVNNIRNQGDREI